MAIFSWAGFSPAVFAQDGSVAVAVDGNPPTGNLIASFDGPEADGLGWYRDEEGWKDIGFSFQAPADGRFQKVTLRVQSVGEGYQQETGFRIEVYENAAMGENPLDGSKVYSGAGKLVVQKSDAELYLTFDLGDAVPLTAGNSYTVLFILEEPAPVVVFQANPAYTEGFAWFRNETTDGKFEPVTDSAKPGLTFFIH